MTRQGYALHASRTVVFWTYKAANTSIVHALAYDVLKLPRDRRDPRLMIEPLLVGWPVALDLIADGYRSIGLIREPYDRLVSAFLHIFVARAGRGIRQLKDLEASGRRGLQQMRGDVGQFEGITFREFVAHCVAEVRARQGEPNLDDHWNTQIPFALYERGFRYDHLFPLTRSGAFFEALSGLVGTRVRERRINVHRRSWGFRHNLVDVTSTRYCGWKALHHTRNFEDPELRAAVEAAYEPDYAYYRTLAS
ncbi:sulfotransferase family 2 domain-containing protein [Devosia sp.]|uniref:sulfotransferase family 2 domain-containing protein n=1 Tax=Devosia sp. TaxID=1871048 RepID=UPI0035B4E1C7